MLLHAFSGTGVWAIDRGTLKAMEERLAQIMTSSGPIAFAPPKLNSRMDGGVAVLSVVGLITYRPTVLSLLFGGTTVLDVRTGIREALNNSSVRSIVLDVDSPGGEVDGIQELADEIYAARSRKRIVAVANVTACSAAYWLASAASELVASPSAQVGSIGVYSMHFDHSKMNEAIGVNPTYVFAGKYKVEGNPDQPLSNDARSAMQSIVDSYYTAFVNGVASYRGASASDVRNRFGQGRNVTAKAALISGMVDRVATLDQTLKRLAGKPSRISAQASKNMAARRREMAIIKN